jgi:hypothetical protein
MNFNTEPVAIAAAIRALLVVAVGFGLDLSGEQVASIVVAVELVLGLFVRSQVTPTVKVDSVSPEHRKVTS